MTQIRFVTSTVLMLAAAVAATPAVPDPLAPPVAAAKVAGPFEFDRGTQKVSVLEARKRQPRRFDKDLDVAGVVFYPNPPGNRMPVAVLLHGMHNTCTVTTTTFVNGRQVGRVTGEVMAHPCTALDKNTETKTAPTTTVKVTVVGEPIKSFRGYDYLAKDLASRGFVVLSIDANSVNAHSNLINDGGAEERAGLVLQHLRMLQEWNGPNGSPVPGIGKNLAGRMDLQNVGLVGHSRGGEGVVHAYADNLLPGQATVFGIRAVYVLAGVNVWKTKRDLGVPYPVTDAHLGVLLPYCDGDVKDLVGVTYFDDSRYAAPNDTGDKSYVVVQGANHNFFNTIWAAGLINGGEDWRAQDPLCFSAPGGKANPNRLSQADQQKSAIALVGGFLRLYQQSETALKPLFTRDAPPPDSLAFMRFTTAFHPRSSDAMVVNRIATKDELTKDTAGGNVTGANPTLFFCNSPRTCVLREPHLDVGQVQLTWQAGDTLTNGLAAGGGTVNAAARGLNFVSFRVAFNDGSRSNTGKDQLKFNTLLLDSGNLGIRIGVDFPAQFSLLRSPGGAASRKTLFQTIRIPLASLAVNGGGPSNLGGYFLADSTKLSQLAFLFASASGSVEICDVMLAR